MELPEQVSAILRAKNIGHLATMDHDRVCCSPVWMDFDPAAQTVLINTEVGTAKDRHLQKNPICSLSAVDSFFTAHWISLNLEVQGRQTGPEARAHIDKLALRYLGRPRIDPGPRVLYTLTAVRLSWWRMENELRDARRAGAEHR